MTIESIRQVLRVVSSFRENRADGAFLEEAAIEAMQAVGKEDRLEDRTIRDACWRRLGLPSIKHFYELLAALERGNPELLNNLLKQHSEPAAHDEINQFFASLNLQRR
jgi:hypothetical protein